MEGEEMSYECFGNEDHDDHTDDVGWEDYENEDHHDDSDSDSHDYEDYEDYDDDEDHDMMMHAAVKNMIHWNEGSPLKTWTNVVDAMIDREVERRFEEMMSYGGGCDAEGDYDWEGSGDDHDYDGEGGDWDSERGDWGSEEGNWDDHEGAWDGEEKHDWDMVEEYGDCSSSQKCQPGLCCAEGIYKDDVVDGDVSESYMDNMIHVCQKRDEGEFMTEDGEEYWTMCK